MFGDLDARYPQKTVDEIISGLWSFSHASGLKTNVLTERTADAGVTVDGVLLKDGVVPKTAYPDAFLLDGTRNVEKWIFVKSDGTTACYFIKKSDDTVLPFFYYQEVLDYFSMGVPTIPLEINTPITQKQDFTLDDDKFIDLGNAAAGLPAAAVAHRGKLGFVEGTAAARDRVYCCMKSDADAYNWIEIATGGA